jgi:hypothetical protein
MIDHAVSAIRDRAGYRWVVHSNHP